MANLSIFEAFLKCVDDEMFTVVSDVSSDDEIDDMNFYTEMR